MPVWSVSEVISSKRWERSLHCQNCVITYQKNEKPVIFWQVFPEVKTDRIPNALTFISQRSSHSYFTHCQFSQPNKIFPLCVDTDIRSGLSSDLWGLCGIWKSVILETPPNRSDPPTPNELAESLNTPFDLIWPSGRTVILNWTASKPTRKVTNLFADVYKLAAVTFSFCWNVASLMPWLGRQYFALAPSLHLG